MDFNDVLARRQMVRNYKEETIDESTLHRIASAALRAPSAGNSQAVGVVVVTDAEKRLSIARLAHEPEYVRSGFEPWISRAPAHLIISVSEKTYRDRYSEPDKLAADGSHIEWPVPYWWIDAGAALMAVLLQTVNENLAAGFLGVHSVPNLASLLNLPADHSPIGVTTIGHPASDRRPGSLDRPRDTIVHRDRWTD